MVDHANVAKDMSTAASAGHAESPPSRLEQPAPKVGQSSHRDKVLACAGNYRRHGSLFEKDELRRAA